MEEVSKVLQSGPHQPHFALQCKAPDWLHNIWLDGVEPADRPQGPSCKSLYLMSHSRCKAEPIEASTVAMGGWCRSSTGEPFGTFVTPPRPEMDL